MRVNYQQRDSVEKEFVDDDLTDFEANGARSLPEADERGYVHHEGAQIWYTTHGSGPPVILLHGGLGHSGNWGHQVPALVTAGYRVVLIDSRGHGRSTRDGRRYTYELMASDVTAVMDVLHIAKAVLVGWSDGACTSLILAMKAPMRVLGVFFFGCNMDPSGTKEVDERNPVIQRCFARHKKDFQQISATPERFEGFVAAVTEMMKTEPNYFTHDLAQIRVPVAIAQSEHDEFIKREHAEYLARSIPNAELILLPGVSHFAPLQRPNRVNSAVKTFLDKIWH
jgi:pimeloyl-ACP methyl ester carboxylesterase